MPQNHQDEPATELLERVRESIRGIRGGAKPNSKQVLEAAGQTSLRTPHGWCFARLGSLCVSITDGDHLTPPKTTSGVPLLVIGNVRSQRINFVGCRYVSEDYFATVDASRRPQEGDLLYTLVGSYGIPVIVHGDRPFCVQRHIGILRPSRLIDIRFLSRALESRFVFDQATSCATGIAQKTVPLRGLRKIVVPLPPIAEQRRIVAKVDELMAVCDKLEAQLSTAETESSRLLEAVLHEALAVA